VSVNGKTKICAIILAAGASKRLGTPKQLIPHNNSTLIGHTIQCTLDSKCDETVVVLGANATLIQKKISNFPVNIVRNQNWKMGMGYTIRVGLEKVETVNNNIQAVVLLVCDQLFLTSKIIDRLIESYLSFKKPIIASEYDGTLGVPVLFNKKFFPELLKIDGIFGAKIVVENHPRQVWSVPFPKGGFDIDTPNDLPNKSIITSFASSRNKL
jgi:molybdenum cofactor cytidylyltransferase